MQNVQSMSHACSYEQESGQTFNIIDYFQTTAVTRLSISPLLPIVHANLSSMHFCILRQIAARSLRTSLLTLRRLHHQLPIVKEPTNKQVFTLQLRALDIIQLSKKIVNFNSQLSKGTLIFSLNLFGGTMGLSTNGCFGKIRTFSLLLQREPDCQLSHEAIKYQISKQCQ